MLMNFIYGVLEAISNAIYTTVATVWQIEQAVINLMMSTFLFILGLACHPIMVIPMLLGCYYVLRNFWYRRGKSPRVEHPVDIDGEPRAGLRNMPRTPRLPTYRSFGNLSNPGNDPQMNN
ncbi:uncharacterized protein LOC108041463 [Drosophila rhopaloa]|uniref:Uncharacterized protein LOC108041463 n=1 Tax=Drosophila rhopaloa TaxID=1041015 RepID=A0A6P4EED9_DRORH|nr:uncharacterized protein LOC108041463 [Drosophila rhopaloa]